MAVSLSFRDYVLEQLAAVPQRMPPFAPIPGKPPMTGYSYGPIRLSQHPRRAH